jgi:hypothetical protein
MTVFSALRGWLAAFFAPADASGVVDDATIQAFLPPAFQVRPPSSSL